MSISIEHRTETVTVWTDHGTPTRLVYAGRRYTVIDHPSPLWGREEVVPPKITHTMPSTGWRTVGRDGDGETLIFDLRVRAGQEWELLHVGE